MGANQSSRSQLGVARHQQHVAPESPPTKGGTLRPANNKQQHKTTASLSSSLRKSVSNVLATNKLSSSGSKSSNNNNPDRSSNSNNKLAKTNRLANIIVGGSHQLDGQHVQVSQSTTDSYYVSPERQQHVASAISKSGRMVVPAASKANNYVCMQQTGSTTTTATTVPTASELDCRDPRREGSVELNGGCNNYSSRPTAYVGSDFYAANEQLPVKDGSFIGGAQDHHHQYNHIHNQPEHHNMGALGRSSQQQQLHHHQQTNSAGQHVHLSRAVNTKTKRVLNNSYVSMPNGNIASSSYGRRQHYLAATADNNNNNDASSLSVQNSPQQQHQIKLTQQLQTSGRKPSYPYHCSDQAPIAHYSSPSLVYGRPAAEQSALFNLSNHQAGSPLCHKRQQQQPQLAYAGPEESENSLPSQQYYLRNCLLGPQQTDLDQQLQMNALHRRYNQSGQYQLAQLDFHQPIPQQQQRLAANQIGDQLTLDCRNYTRSHSFGGGSRTLESKKKNPLAALFQNGSSKNHSNTIHLGRRNKSSILPGLNGSGNSNAGSNQRSCPGSLKRIKPAPLTAQQASYEAMRTIDMYLIRQIARSCMVSSSGRPDWCMRWCYFPRPSFKWLGQYAISVSRLACESRRSKAKGLCVH